MTNQEGIFEGEFKAKTIPFELHQLCRSVNRYFDEQGIEPFCDVAIKKDGKWFVFDGSVNSHRTRATVFLMVPESEGTRYVIDNLCVGTPVRKDLAS